MASKAQQGRANGWRLLGWGGAAALLLVPLAAGFPWTLSDYVFAGAVFAMVGGAFELAVRKSGNGWYRAGVAVALATAFLLVWINGAVGIIGSEDNRANLMFLGVIGIAIAAAVGSRFEARGMAYAMALAAGSQMLVAMIVLAFGMGAAEPPFFPRLPLLIGILAVPWLVSAALFRKAASTS